MASKKMWGKKEFWGISSEFDQHWFLTSEQKQLQAELIELCRTTLRPNAVRYDKTYEFPRENIDALAGLGLLGLLVPKELNGLGQNHQCAVMVCETISRYGCSSTGLVFVMHTAAVAGLLYRYHNNDRIKDLLRRLDKDKLLGTLSFSDPATGGHFWYSLSSKCWKLPNDLYKVLKFSSWTTSGGFADWYMAQTVSPDFDGDFSNLSNFLFYKDEVRASTDEWSALGVHGNQSGPMVCEATLESDRVIGPIGDGRSSNDEIVDPFFLLCSASVWNGIAMGSIDLAKRHVCSKTHGDVGVRVCDYPIIQDTFGDVIISTNCCRSMNHSVAFYYDQNTNNNDWSIHADISVMKRAEILPMAYQVKCGASQNAAHVVDKMLFACGGTGYKTELGLERLVRDAKAGWVMAPTNEILRSWIGKCALMGMEAVDFWGQLPDQRILRAEIRKLNAAEKENLANSLFKELKREKGEMIDKFDFDNPLSPDKPSTIGVYTRDGVPHSPAFSPSDYTSAEVSKIDSLTSDKKYALFTFKYPDSTMHSGCKIGQYLEIQIPGSKTHRFLSPVSRPDDFGRLEVAIRYESHGALANYFETIKLGDYVHFKGPCGGLEYGPNLYKHIVFICGGIGISPAVQISRSVISDPADQTEISLFYQSKVREDLLFRSELDIYATKNDRFHVNYTLQDPDEDWSGSEGFIDYTFLKKHLPTAAGDGSMKVVICGGTQMITVCLNALSLLDFRSEDIYIYGPFAAEQIRSVYGRSAKLFTR